MNKRIRKKRAKIADQFYQEHLQENILALANKVGEQLIMSAITTTLLQDDMFLKRGDTD